MAAQWERAKWATGKKELCVYDNLEEVRAFCPLGFWRSDDHETT